jgi:hypothetical protein
MPPCAKKAANKKQLIEIKKVYLELNFQPPP